MSITHLMMTIDTAFINIYACGSNSVSSYTFDGDANMANGQKYDNNNSFQETGNIAINP